ncbi:uncharacterized protein LOC129601867, partial [Paramacrobiotus metropolitanus]|uniref:uncharacterized protein LOC129601867 n=1 Tax=Paramacrobiotus metropolitanus TaxID=2943436 RepID=UPI002445F895
MNTTTRYFRDLFKNAREMHHGNTVLVQRDAGQSWWMGFVRDIQDDRFLVDFDASSVPAQWVPAQQLFPHHFLSLNNAWEGTTVQVALRTAADQPMVFRSCTLIKEEKYYGLLCMVRLQDDGSVHVVHRNHLVTTLPPDDSECFAGRRSGFLFRRYEIAVPLGQALTTVDFLAIYVNQVCQLKLKPGRGVLCDASCPVTHDQGVDDMVFTCAGRHQKMQGARYTFAIGCRVFARLTDDHTVVFVCAEMHGNEEGHSLFWTADSLRSALLDYVKEDLVGQRLRLMFLAAAPC